MAAAPAILTASKSGSAHPIVGTGAYQYEVIHDWGELPARMFGRQRRLPLKDASFA